MARPLRIEFPGAFYHVMNRGNTGMNIYRSARDREKFLEYVGEVVKRYGIKVHTYCLMTTHYHFLTQIYRVVAKSENRSSNQYPYTNISVNRAS